jgi:hypothetical protein
MSGRQRASAAQRPRHQTPAAGRIVLPLNSVWLNSQQSYAVAAGLPIRLSSFCHEPKSGCEPSEPNDLGHSDTANYYYYYCDGANCEQRKESDHAVDPR